MRYNLGCGADYRSGWINVDRALDVSPDVICDLGIFPWPFADESADEIAIIHLLDEVLTTGVPLLTFMRELYRICKNGAKVTIRNTDPRHADTAFTSQGSGGVDAAAFQSYDVTVVEEWIAKGHRSTPTSLYAKIDFGILSLNRFLDEPWLERWRSGNLTDEALTIAVRSQNNVVAASEVILSARKPFVQGRSLALCDALVLVRRGGLGDVLMALSACRAVKATLERPIYLLTAPDYQAFADLCPHIDRAFSDEAALQAHAASLGQKILKVVDLSPVRFGLSRLHQVDAFLQALAIAPPDNTKGLDIDLSGVRVDPFVQRRLEALTPGPPRIVIHPGVSDPNRTWPKEFWQDLAQHCIGKGYAVISIGQSRNSDGRSVAKLDDSQVVDFSDHLDLASSLHVLRSCDLLISADSGPIQLAGASDIAVIGLYSVVGGERRLPYRSGSFSHKTLALSPGCAFSPCYRWMTDPATQAAFSRTTGIDMANLPTVFSRWCINPDQFSCVRESSMLDMVKAAIPSMLISSAAA